MRMSPRAIGTITCTIPVAVTSANHSDVKVDPIVAPYADQLGDVYVSAEPVEIFGPSGTVCEGAINDRLGCRSGWLWWSQPPDLGPEPLTSAQEPNDLPGESQELSVAVAAAFDPTRGLDPDATRKTIEVTAAVGTKTIPRTLDFSLAWQSHLLSPVGLLSRTAAEEHTILAGMKPPVGDSAMPVPPIPFPATPGSQQSNSITQTRPQGAGSLEQPLDRAATGRRRPTTLLEGAGMRSRQRVRSTPKMASAQLTIRTSICLGEPILVVISLLSEPLVVVTGLVALGLAVLFLLR
jgi:hypothetical protein